MSFSLPLRKDEGQGKEKEDKNEQDFQPLLLEYDVPDWACLPDAAMNFRMETLKSGVIIDTIKFKGEKDHYMFGRLPICDFELEHGSISRYHAVLQFGKDAKVYMYDLDSTHGT